MKNSIKILLISLVIFFAASCGERPVTFFDGDFEAKVCYTRLGKEYTAIYTKTADSETLEMLSPDSLRGLTAVRNSGGVTLGYTDLSFSSVSDGIFDPFVLLGECEMIKTDENIYKTQNGDITLCTDGVSPKEIFGTAGGEEYKIMILEFSGQERNGAE